MAAIAVGAFTVLPCLAPKYGRQPNDQPRLRHPRNAKNFGQLLCAAVFTAKLESVTIRAIVVQTVPDVRKPAHRKICFGGVQISGGGVHTQTVTNACARNFLPGANGHGVPEQTTEPKRVELILGAIFNAGCRRGCCPRERGHRPKRSSAGKTRFPRKWQPGRAFLTSGRIWLI